MNLLITRHGETLWNTELRMQGQQNSPLTAKGIDGAINLGKELALSSVTIDKLITSPMPRALHTSSLILEQIPYRIPLSIDERLMEMDLGLFEGMTKEYAKENYTEAFHYFRNNAQSFVPVDGGETFYDVMNRAEDFISSYRGKEGTILVVSHMIVIEAMKTILEKRDISTMRGGAPIMQTTIYNYVI